MPATVRYDEQYCPIARALDVLGDRWTLLILRELVAGDRRFTDLRANLPGITPGDPHATAPDADRAGPRAQRAELPPPSARSAYHVTDRGREAIPVMRALVRFGMPLLEPTDGPARAAVDGGATSPSRATTTPSRPTASTSGTSFRIDGEEHVLSSVKGGGPDRDPDLILESDAALWIELRQGRTTIREALATGRLQTTGPRTALRHLQRIFHLDA